MATKEELQQKLIAKLKELFQLDQPDLDFGFYRVMHVKQKEISEYLEKKLPDAISAAFKDSNGAQLQQDFDAAKQAVVAALGAAAINADGSLNPAFSTTPTGQQYVAAKTALDAGAANVGAEADVYDHLYHFFERYYDKGDFVSLRYLTRETDRKAKPYAIPYAGEEVMLHWANADQYYIKTSENFSHYSFDLTKFAAFEKMNEMERMAAQVPSDPLKVHFEIVDAEEGEHGNVKTGKDRFFILHDGTPCALEEDGLHIFFEYREDPNMTGQVAKWQEKLRGDAFEALKTLVPDIGKAMGKMVACPPPNSERLPDYVRLLFMEMERTKSDGKKEKYTPLAVYLKRYMARNTADYFIHKDLGGFLRRELDFYIKNDLMELDNVVAATPESVAKWLGTLKVFRKIAEDIITFLAQLEDFQKKLWLKKKFIVQCDYCLTMDRVPDALKPEVLANQKQLDAWKALNTDADPKAEDMTAIDARMVDTQYFDESFKQKLLASIDNFDEQCDGVLIHSDNFQGLMCLQGREYGCVKAVYADPPYNADATCILYKNGYRHSSWLSLILDRMIFVKGLMRSDAAICVTIDDYELYGLKLLMDNCFGSDNFLATVPIRNNPSGRSTVSGFAICHEYGMFYARDMSQIRIGRIEHTEEQKSRYNLVDELGRQFEWENLRKSSASSFHEDRPKQYYPLYCNPETGKVRVPECIWNETDKSWETKDSVNPGEVEVFPIDNAGRERVWSYGIERVKTEVKDISVKCANGVIELYKKKFLHQEGMMPRTWWDKPEYSARDNGTRMISNLFGNSHEFDFPKAVEAVADTLKICGGMKDALILDYFGGSGTTAHAVIDLNRQDGGKRKYILIEMGDHFDTVLMPRVKKVVYSPDWKDGKPTASAKGISHCFKYFRLESYEDALNNLQVDSAKGAAFAGVGDYFFKYMLDVETKGSPSLLNVEQFSNPFGYKLIVKKPGSEEREERTVDLVETFNYLIGLRVKHTAATVGYNAEFERAVDPELPTDAHTKLTIKGKIKLDEAGPWKFRTVEGWCPKNRATPNDGAKERVLIVWRTLTGDSEKDNAVLNAFLQRKDVNALDGEFDVIYVNGSNNVPNLKKENDVWKVRLIEEDFRARMWEGL